MKTKNVKMTMLVSVGAALEYYDFVIYGMMASYLILLFFDTTNPHVDMIKTFSIFSIGYLFRPIGGLIAGMVSDQYGRIKVIQPVMLLMGCATFVIGCLPTVHTAGLFAPVGLLVLRILQGLSFGAELPGAITMMKEQHDTQHTGMHCGFVISSTAIGAILASFVLYLLSRFFSEQEILAGAWRLPFLLGGLLAVLSFFMRKWLEETDSFKAFVSKNVTTQQKLWSPVLSIYQNYKRAFFFALALLMLSSAMIITNLYLPTYLSVYYNIEKSDIFLATSISLCLAAATLPFFGRLADKLGAQQLILFSASGFAVFALSCTWVLPMLKDFYGVLIFLSLFQLFIASYTAASFSFVANIFPVSVRFTGIALTYNLAYVLCSLLPSLSAYMIASWHTVHGIFYVLMCVTLLAIASIKLAKKNYLLEI